MAMNENQYEKCYNKLFTNQNTMSTPDIQHFIKAINNPVNFNSMKSFRLELNDIGTPVLFQKGNMLCFRMYCSQHKRSLAISCFVGHNWMTNYYLEKIAKWHNRNNEKIESHIFLYLQGELLINDYGNYDIIVSEWNNDIETNFSFNIGNSVRIVDEVAFSADMKRLIAFPLPNKLIKSYAIPEGVTTIGEKAFEGCTQLQEVIIPNSVTTIEDEAFYCSYQIRSLTIPDSVTHIGAAAFSMIRIESFHIPYNVKITGGYFISCPDLMTITLGENHPLYIIVDNVLFSYNKKKLLRYPPARLGTTYTVPDGVEMIGDYAFSGCRYLTEIIIPESVTSIDEYAFEHAIFKTIIFPRNINFIGDGIFHESTNLESFIFPSNLTKISSAMFMSCNALVNIEIPNHINSIEDYAFSYCENLRQLNIPNSVISIGENAFAGCKGFTSVFIPQNVKSIGKSVFAYCDCLVEIEFFGEISIIQEATFEYCSNLQTIVFPNGLTKIAERAFSNCTTLKSIIIPEGVTEIGEGAFSFCSELYSVQLPKSLVSIAEEAFLYCTKLIKIDLPRNVTTIGNNAFEHCENLNYGFKLGLINRFGESVLNEDD